jgi:histone acetyltransferase (RNA polymerase elongator complex component)
MNTLAIELRKKFEGCSPSINYLTAVDQRCIRVEYSTSEKLRWLEIWSSEVPGQYNILRSEQIKKPFRGISKVGVVEVMKTKFTLPEK